MNILKVGITPKPSMRFGKTLKAWYTNLNQITTRKKTAFQTLLATVPVFVTLSVSPKYMDIFWIYFYPFFVCVC